MSTLIKREIEDKSIIWFENANQYLILENITAEVILQLNQKIDSRKIANYLTKELNVPLEQAIDFVLDVDTKIAKPYQKITSKSNQEKTHHLPKQFELTKQYAIHKTVIKINYESEFEQFLIHPKFAHLETQKQQKPDVVFSLFKDKESIALVVNNELINSWQKPEFHYLQGKVSMKIVEHIYQVNETDWLGVFHASAIANANHSMLFLGDSGNGKSTSLALLQANGFICMADDFVPVNNQQLVHSFPAAISIKKSSLDVLTPLYPSLKNTKEFHLKSLHKTVRYLASNSINFDAKLPCKALVFIKYDTAIDLEIKSIDKTEAFQQLIPDSWISPLAENVNLFLDWFLSLPCYQLIYSNNTKMIETVTKLFNDEL